MRTLLIALGGYYVFDYGSRKISAYLKSLGYEIDLLFVPFVLLDKRKTFLPHKKFFDEALARKIIHPLYFWNSPLPVSQENRGGTLQNPAPGLRQDPRLQEY